MSDDQVTVPDDDNGPPDDGPTEEHAHDDAPASPLTPCSQCGASLDADQQYCLECGAPTPNAVQLRERRSIPALVAAALLALGVGGASLIYALTRDDSDSGTATTGTIPTIPPLPTFPTGTNPFPTTSTTLPPFPTTTAPPFTSTTTTTPPSGPNYDEEDDWQYEFETRWTVIMQSARTPQVAVDYCESLRRQGVTCGVLNSSFYSSLRPGYFAVFHGAYLTQSAAQAEQRSLASRFPSSYVRRVES